MTTDTRPRSVADLQRPTDRRTIEQKVYAEPVTVRFGGTEHQLRLLTISEAKVWKKAAATDMTAILSTPADDGAALVAGIVGLVAGGHDRMLDLIISYDLDDALPDRQAIEDTATEPEVEDAFLAIMAVAFPFGRMLQRMARGMDSAKLADAVKQLIEAREREKAQQRLTEQRSTQS